MSRSFPALAGSITLALTASAALFAAGCAKSPAPEPQAAATSPAEQPVTAATAAPEGVPAEDAAAAAAREQELAAKQVELELREREIAAREAAAAAAAAKPKPAATPKPATTNRPAASEPVPAPPPPPVTVPAGTQLSVKLNSPYSTKTTVLGETVDAELAADLVVDGRRVARAGAPISGSVTEVTSGSKKIGAVPALKIDFTQLVVADGTTLPVSVRIMQKGQSEKGRDTAKIVGGTAAGAIIGHQINDDKGKIIGGVLGGAAGAVAAQKTGTEVEIPAGTVLPANVRTAFEYKGR